MSKEHKNELDPQNERLSLSQTSEKLNKSLPET